MKNLKKSELKNMDNFTLKTMEYNGEKVLVKVYETVNDNINTFKKYGLIFYDYKYFAFNYFIFIS